MGKNHFIFGEEGHITEMEFRRILEDSEIFDLNPPWTEGTQLVEKSSEYVKWLKEQNNVDVDYKNLQLCLLTKDEKFVSNERQIEKDNDVDEHNDENNDEEENDPQYKLFLGSLQEHGKSYVLKYEEDSLCFPIKYEGDSNLDDEYDPEPQRKLRDRRPSVQKPGLSKRYTVDNQYEHDLQYGSRKEGENLKRRRLRNTTSREMVEAVKHSINELPRDLKKCTSRKSNRIDGDSQVYSYGFHATVNEDGDVNNHNKDRNMILKRRKKLNKTVEWAEVGVTSCSDDFVLPDSDYLMFLQNSKTVDGHHILSYMGPMIVYGEDDIENGMEKGDNDGGISDFEDADIASVGKDRNLNRLVPNPKNNKRKVEEVNAHCSMHPKFREQVMRHLRKPYNREEYNKLLREIEERKPVCRNMDLRHGREMAYTTTKSGKSYLDYHPDLQKEFFRFQDDKPKHLNIMRGFFYWLQNLTQRGSFKPWTDPQCLAVRPDS